MADVNVHGHTLMLVYSEGHVLWVPPRSSRTDCEMDLTYWPFDTHTCFIKYASWAYSGDELNLTPYDAWGNGSTVKMLRKRNIKAIIYICRYSFI